MNFILVLKIAMPVLPASLSITCQTVIFVVSGPSCCYQQRLSSAMGAVAAKLMGNEKSYRYWANVRGLPRNGYTPHLRLHHLKPRTMLEQSG
jgi:hypothetical protein